MITQPGRHNRFADLIRGVDAACRDTRGNVVMIFALSTVVIFGFVGAAIDFSRVDAARRHLQDAADIAVLRSLDMKSASDATRAIAADRSFNQNFNNPGVSGIAGTLERDQAGNVINETYTVHATVSSYFGAFFGKDNYPVTVVSQAQTSLDVFEIAFVLDSTGSMNDNNKMPNLKTSVDSALASLVDSKGKNQSGSKVAIVPFNTQVRLANTDLSNLSNQGLSSGGGGNCVVDRTQSYDVSGDAAIKGKAKTLYPVSACDESTLQPVQGLNSNIATSRSFIKSLKPGGSTNITVGVQWGMEVLSPNQPFNGAVAFGDTSAKKFMIVVTDGDNTKNRWCWNSTNIAQRTAVDCKDATAHGIPAYSWSAADIDARTALACQDAKTRGITIYTVKVIEGNSNMLRACATAPENFYDLTSASQLNATMSGIFKSINKTRLSM